MKNKFFLYILFFLCSLSVSAQKAFPVCQKSVYNMGVILESKGKVEHTFIIKNIGKGPLVIQKCKASCGCTIPSWSKSPIPSGKTGTVKVVFNPKDLPGTFVKTVEVYNNATSKPMILTIRGEVKP